MSDVAEKLRDLKDKNKALRNFLRQSEDEKKKMENEISDLHIQNQKMSDMLETETAAKQRLVKRIDLIQSEKEQIEKNKKNAGGSWFGGGGGQLKEELEDCQTKLEIAEEELEAKIQENCKYQSFLIYRVFRVGTHA